MIKKLIVPLFLLSFLFVPSLRAQCDLNSTPANFTAQVAAAQPGQTVCLAAGSYGQFNGVVKAQPGVVITAAPGASVTIGGGTFSNSSVRNITIKNIAYTGPVEISSGAGGLNLVFDGDSWANVGHGEHEGRVSIFCSSGCGASGVHIMNSKFGPGACADGIQVSSPGVEIGGNEFTGLLQGSCTEHVDPIQLYAGDTANIHDNWIHGNDSGIMAPDGSNGTILTNNVIKANNNYDMVLGDLTNAVITHNVADADIYDGNPTDQPGCSAHKSSNDIYRDNVGTMSGCGTNITSDHNASSVTFVGGSNPTSFAGYATASPLGTASDGKNIGINLGGPPPAPPSGVSISVR